MTEALCLERPGCNQLNTREAPSTSKLGAKIERKPEFG